MKNSFRIKKMVGVAILTALVVVLQLLSLVIKFGPFSATLALVPIVLGAILYGPGVGLFLGFAMGLVTLFDAAAFMAVDVVATVFVCLLKASMAGLVSGLIFKGLKNVNFVLAIVLAAISAPIVNTGIFVIGCYLFFFETIKKWAGGGSIEATKYLFLTMLGINFIIEFSLNSVISPALTYVVKIVSKNHNLGFAYDFSQIVESNRG